MIKLNKNIERILIMITFLGMGLVGINLDAQNLSNPKVFKNANILKYSVKNIKKINRILEGTLLVMRI